jgi:hypothetical protein
MTAQISCQFSPDRAGELRQWMTESVHAMLVCASDAGFHTAETLAILRETIDEEQDAYEKDADASTDHD